MSKWLKKDDKVIVTAGNDRGRTGVILSRKGDRVVVQGINLRKKHTKRKTRVAGPDILEYEMPIHISNVSLCSEMGKPVKIKVKASDGSKVLFYLEDGKEVVHRQIKKGSK